MNKELWVKLKNNIAITSWDGEGLSFDLDTRKYYIINESAVLLLKLLKANNKGLPVSFLKSLLTSTHSADENKIHQDIASFVQELKHYNLIISCDSVTNSNIKTEKLEDTIVEDYKRPMIEEEMKVEGITGQVKSYSTPAAPATGSQSYY